MEEKKGINKKIVVAVAATVAIIGLAAAIIGFAAGDAPVNRIANSAKKTVDAAKKQESFVAVNEVLNGGSVEVSMNTAKLTYGFLNADVKAKLYSAQKDGAVALSAGASMNGTNLLDAAVWLDREDLIASSETLLEENYGISLKDLPENAKDSALLKLLGVQESIPEVTVSEELQARLQEMDEELSKDCEKFLKKAIKQLDKSVRANAETDKREVVLDFNGEALEANAIEIKFLADEAAEIVSEMAEYLSRSKDFETLLVKYADYLEEISDELSYEIADKKEFISAVYDTLDVIMDAKKAIVDALEEREITIVAYISQTDGCLAGIEVVAENAENEVAGSVMAGPTLEDLREICFVLKDAGVEYKAEYLVEKNDNTSYQSVLNVWKNENRIAGAFVEWDKTDGAYVFGLNGTNSQGTSQAYEISGVINTEKEITIIELERAVLAGDEYEPGITITVDREDEIPDKPEYSELLTMEEEELQGIVDDITRDIGGLLGLFL